MKELILAIARDYLAVTTLVITLILIAIGYWWLFETLPLSIKARFGTQVHVKLIAFGTIAFFVMWPVIYLLLGTLLLLTHWLIR